MNLNWTEDDLRFEAEVNAFLHTHLTDDIREAGKLMTSVYGDHELSMKWQLILNDKGWAAPSWAVEYGGCDWTISQHYIFNREKALAGAPPVSPMGIQMCAPAIIEFGTEEQKSFYLPRMLNGEHFWCQGYSEPGSGSDLASLQMSAVSDGDDFICNGSKIWTTHANEANWVFCLVRTTKADKPQQGITFLLIDMTTPGVEVQPIIGLTGEHIQNQIFFTDVRVPKANVIGEIDKGWTVAKYLMEFERGGAAYAPLINAHLDEIAEFARTTPGEFTDCLLDDPHFSHKLADARIQTSALNTFELQLMAKLNAGHSPGTASSVVKILGTELQQRVTELAMEAGGQYSLAYQPQRLKPGGPIHFVHAHQAAVGPELASMASLRYFNERAGTIYAGSNEIQRNILAKGELGL